jgi:polar amino acid transport system substrate-binding protein
VQAVVYDSPVLLYHAANDGDGKFQVVGPIFRKEDYGIVVADSSPLRKRINTALLSLRESGEYESLYDKWFSEKT